MNQIGFVFPGKIPQAVEKSTLEPQRKKIYSHLLLWVDAFLQVGRDLLIMMTFLLMVRTHTDPVIAKLDACLLSLSASPKPAESSLVSFFGNMEPYVLEAKHIQSFCLSQNLSSVRFSECHSQVHLYFNGEWRKEEIAYVQRLVQQVPEFWNRYNERILLSHLVSFGLSASPSDMSVRTADGSGRGRITIIAKKEDGGNRFCIEGEYLLSLRSPSGDAILFPLHPPVQEVTSNWFLNDPGT